jgi:hypothetical protein
MLEHFVTNIGELQKKMLRKNVGKLPKNVDEKIFATFLKNVDGKILTIVQKLLIKIVKARGAFWDMNPLSGLFGSLWAL